MTSTGSQTQTEQYWENGFLSGINILSPETGSFKVVVHDHTSNTYTGANDVTVVIFAGGYQVFTDTRTITGEDTYTEFAEIEWPSMICPSSVCSR